MPTRALVLTSVPGFYRRDDKYVVVARDAQRRQVKRFAGTMADARAIKAQLTTSRATGTPLAVSKETFADCVSQWIHNYRGRTSRGLRESTVEGYRRVILDHAIPFFGNTRLADIHLRDIKRYTEHISERGVSRATVRIYTQPVQLMLATAVEDGSLMHNPASGFHNVYGHKGRAGQRKALTDRELDALLRELPARYRLLGQFLADTGLRIGEAAGLRWDDVELPAAVPHAHRRYFRGTFDEPKTVNGIRTIPLTGSLVDQLAKPRLALGARPEDLVFPTEVGTPFDSRVLRSRIFKPAARRADVPWASMHTLRHTCASRLFRNGWNAKQVQMMLGHHSPAFTMATYIHLIPNSSPGSGDLHQRLNF